MAFIGAIGLGLTQGVMFTALHLTSAVNAGIVFALGPMVTMVLARVFLTKLMAFQFGTGDLLAFVAFAAALRFASYIVLLKRARFALPPIAMITVLLIFGSLAALPFAAWEYLSGAHANLGREGLLALLYCGIIGGAVIYLLYNLSIDILGAARAGTLVYTQMIFVALFAWLLLGEPIRWYHAAGAWLVIAGVLLVTTLRPHPRTVPHPH